MKKKRMAISILAIFAVCVMIGGGAYAYFSDTESTAGNQFTAATLNLEINDEDPWAIDVFDVTFLKPGDSGYTCLKIENTGSTAGTLTIDIPTITDGAGTTPEPEPTPDNGEISENLDIVVWEDANQDGVVDVGETTLYIGKLSAATTGPWSYGSFGVGATDYISISYSVDTSVANDIMGDTCTFTIEFVLTQS